MRTKQFKEQVQEIRQIVLAAIPRGYSFSAIIVALAQCIVIYEERRADVDG